MTSNESCAYCGHTRSHHRTDYPGYCTTCKKRAKICNQYVEPGELNNSIRDIGKKHGRKQDTYDPVKDREKTGQ